MCPNCDNVMKLDAAQENAYCTRCGARVRAEDAFVFYELKARGEGGEAAADAEGRHVLLRSGVAFLEQGRHDLADSCFEKATLRDPDDWEAWKLRAQCWEARVLAESGKPFYAYDYETKELVEDTAAVERYKELCREALRCCPQEMSGALAEEVNERAREHFRLAYRAFRHERHRVRFMQLSAVLFAAILVILAYKSCAG